MKNHKSVLMAFLCLVAVGLAGCNKSSTTTDTTGTTRTIDANETNLQSVSTNFDGSHPATCEQVSRDTSGCQSAREALGLSGHWLDFSCNVVEGLADSSKNSTTTYSNAAYVTLAIQGLPDYKSNYWPTTGSYDFTANGDTVTGTFDSLYSAFTAAFPDPNTIGVNAATFYIPISPTQASAKSQQMGMGAVGVAINGIVIYDSVAGNTDNIFAEGGSFDGCGGHADNSSSYHYHGEPYSISYNDNKIIGVMRDGFFIYGRNDSSGSAPGTIANEEADPTGDIYVYGGHVGSDPTSGTGSSFHYHLTEWKGCYDEPGMSKAADDGETDDTINSGVVASCGGQWIDAWFLSGHGNGGVFNTLPTGFGTGHQTPSQEVTAIRYYYGTAGTCTGAPGC